VSFSECYLPLAGLESRSRFIFFFDQKVAPNDFVWFSEKIIILIEKAEVKILLIAVQLRDFSKLLPFIFVDFQAVAFDGPHILPMITRSKLFVEQNFSF
jgi:hypothetical protein